MISVQNPFLISGYISPDYFCDREKETLKIIDGLQNGRNITLMSPRRMGKTGLIRHIFYLLRDINPQIEIIYMDIFSTQCLDDFVKVFANSVLGKLDSAPQKAWTKVSQFLKSCRPSLSFDELSGAPKISVDIAQNNGEATIKEIFEYLAASGRECYIAIDEFQQITEYPEKGVEALLRSYIQFIPNLHFIFAGSKCHIMQEMFSSAKRPFYQSTQSLYIGTIDEEAYYNFANGYFMEKEIDFPQPSFRYLYNRFDGHTWYIQCILNRLYGYSKVVTNELIEYAINEIVEENTYNYESLLSAYTPGNVKLLKAIAKERCVKEILSGTFISKYALKAASSVNSSLEKLINKELIYRTPSGYIIYDRFMNEWLHRLEF